MKSLGVTLCYKFILEDYWELYKVYNSSGLFTKKSYGDFLVI